MGQVNGQRLRLLTDAVVSTGITKYFLIDCKEATHVGIQLRWVTTGSGAVTVTLWETCEERPSSVLLADFMASDGYFSAMTDVTLLGPAAAAASGVSMVNIDNVCGTYIRGKIAYASGTNATIQGYAVVKG